MADIIKSSIAKIVKNKAHNIIPKHLRDQFIQTSYCYPYQDISFRKQLSGEMDVNKVYSYFKKTDLEYWEAHKRFKKLLGNGFFNPYKEYDLLNYFIYGESYAELDFIYEFIKRPDIKENIVYKGEKGSGKTALINCWLCKNNKELEKNKIFWIRCDGHSLYGLWLHYLKAFRGKEFDETKIITVEEYLTIQLLYVFCKYTLDSNGIFINEIISLLQNRKPQYEYQVGRKMIHDTESRLIYDGLLETRDIINKMEKGKKDFYNYALDYVMGVSASSTHQRHKNRWISLSDALTTFLTENGYWILKVVDGVDNVHINDDSAKPYYERMLDEAFDFLIRTPNDRHIHLMVMREKTFIECRHRPPMPDTTGYIDVHKIDHKASDFREILIKRKNIYSIRYSNDKTLFTEICNKVCESISNSHIKKLNHNNARTFLYNKLSLISLVYYRIKQLRENIRNIDIRNIEQHIRTFELRNKYLNGRLYLDTAEDWHNMNSEIGLSWMNIFYFNSHTFPCQSIDKWQGLCKTRILQLLSHYGRMDEEQLVDYLILSIEYDKELVLQNISDLKAFGMIDTKWDHYIYLEISQIRK